MLGVFAAGRILNAKTARSQMIGGMTWGIGSALIEENHVDLRYGSFVNQDLASYHVAVNADVGAMDVVFLRRGRSSWQSARQQGHRRARHLRSGRRGHERHP